MSSDDGYIIQKMDNGSFVVRYYNASGDEDILNDGRFAELGQEFESDNLEDCLNYINEQYPTEYGIRYINMEPYIDIVKNAMTELSKMISDATRRMSKDDKEYALDKIISSVSNCITNDIDR